ncbi:uncharacterized protein LOC126997559 [Eriocheir sinensis]|uniref:uncharacterized protein LOC126997559 n=1 Tax=Eriocheir sinensis TaxID=95602 RepID=UPI0021C738F2|nr:uncharacterized protein LOC126997559 [Eriocheir sinensis]
MFVVVRMLPFTVAPYLACLLVLLAPTLAQETEVPPRVTPDQSEPEQPPVLLSQPASAPPVQTPRPIQPAPPPVPTFIDTSDFESTSLQVTACPPEQIYFELVTGYVYSAPADMLDSQPGTLMLTDCIDMCRRNRSCMAVNYETGLCVLFSSNADMYPGSLTSSQFPVFTLYVQKNCLLNAPACDRAWSFERVMGFELAGYAKRNTRVGTRQECEILCLQEQDFPCRSANFNNSTGDCATSDMDRHTAVGTGSFRPSENSDFLENNCVDDPVRLCEFQKMEGRILKTVDSVYQDVVGLEECKRLCLTASFRCHSFDYGDTGDRVCRLSHHAAATLTHIEEPYLEIPGSSTYELSSCYNVTIDCRSGDMVARVKTSKIFNGKIYAKGSPNTCVNDIEDALEFELRMSYNDIDCDVERESVSRYKNDVVIQHHDMIVTSADLGLIVHCQYDLTNKSVSNRVDLTVEDDRKPVLEQGSTVDSPNVIMRVANRDGNDITDASVGDMLQLRFEIVDRNSPYEIFVRDLVAMDGSNTNNITLLDGRGCPSEISILRPLEKVDFTGKVLGASFDAFKFPTNDVVQFRALVTPCIPTCEPVVCDVLDFGGQMKQAESYGRKKREALPYFTDFGSAYNFAEPTGRSMALVSQLGSNTFDVEGHSFMISHPSHDVSRQRREAPEQEIPEELLVVQSIKISDKFGFRSSQIQSREGAANNLEKDLNSASIGGPEVVMQEDVSGVCINMVGLVLACSVFLVAQLVIIVAWTAVWHRRRRSKLEEPLSPATTTESLRQLYDSGYPRRI